MLLPSKYQPLHKNLLVIGAEAIHLLQSNDYNIHALYLQLKNKKDISLNDYFHLLTFLWLANIITIENTSIKIIIPYVT